VVFVMVRVAAEAYDVPTTMKALARLGNGPFALGLRPRARLGVAGGSEVLIDFLR
jgi:hypothetical protein